MKRIARNCCILCMIILGGIGIVTAQPYQIQKSTVSDVEFYVTNYGIFGLDLVRSNSGFTVPRGSGLTYMFGGGLWFGAKKRVGADTNKLVFITYDALSAASWAVPYGADVPATAEPLYHSTDYDRHAGTPIANPNAPVWPLWLRPFDGPEPADPGLYEPEWKARHASDYYSKPAFMSGVAEQFVARFDDHDISRYEHITADSARALGLPMGLDIIENVYAWSDGPFKDVVMVNYAVTNTSRDSLLNCVLSQMTDPDIGFAANDHCSFFKRRPDLRAAYAWTDPEAKNYKVLATAIVEGPVLDESGFISRAYIDARKPYRALGSVGTFQSWAIENEPAGIAERYDFMSDRTQHDGDAGASDRRMLMSTTPFNMRPGDVAHFTVMYAVISAKPSEAEESLPGELEQLIEAVNDAYYDQKRFPTAVPLDPGAAVAAAAVAIPNPARDRATVRFTAAAAGTGRLHVVNAVGQEVIFQDLGRLERGAHEATVDVKGLPAGLYLVSIISGTQISTTKLTVAR